MAPMVNTHHHCSRFFGFGNGQKAEPFERAADALNGRFAALNAARSDAFIFSFILFCLFCLIIVNTFAFWPNAVAGGARLEQIRHPDRSNGRELSLHLLLDCKCKVMNKKNAAEGIFRRVRVLPSLGKSFSGFAEFLPKTGVFCQSFAEFFTKFLSQHATCYFALVFSSNSNVRSPILLYALNRLPLTGALSSRHSSTGFVKLCTSMRCTFLRAGRC